MLEHHPDVATQLGQIGLGIPHVDAVHNDFALLEGFKSVYRLDECGFAGTGGTADHHDFALFHGRGAIFQNLK